MKYLYGKKITDGHAAFAVVLILLLSFNIINNVFAAEKEGLLEAKQSIIKDVTFLASDQLKGRANFSSGIAQAADYISQRFSEIGLKPLKDEVNFKQSFSIFNITSKLIKVKLNGFNIADENLTVASTMETISWENKTQFNTRVIGEQDDLRLIINELNQAGGKHLVLLNKSHIELFTRYKTFFQRGLSKLDVKDKGAIVIILTNEKKIETISVDAVNNIYERQLANVVGVLAGKTKPEEVILYSAHYDHLGERITEKGDSNNSDLIYNGADDDASGTTAVINLASYFSKHANNARTLVFTAFAAEEIGGFGSQYFSKQLNPDNVTAMINIEMVGKPSKFGVGTLWMTGTGRSNLWHLLNKELEKHHKKIYQDPYPKQRLFYRSDNATLARLGVPAHSFSSTQLDKDQHYHQVSDEVESLDFSSMAEVINSLALATEGLVMGFDTPSRINTAKIKERGKIF